MKLSEIRLKASNTFLVANGYSFPSQCPSVREKIKKSVFDKFGVDNVSQSAYVKQKIKETCFSRYGVSNPLQDADIASKAFKNAFKLKLFTFPNGREVVVQGYENFALMHMIDIGISEDDIDVDRKSVPVIWYNFENTKRRYYVDVYVRSLNKCIEVKSEWTIKLNVDKIKAKFTAVIEQGHLCEILVFHKDGGIIKSITDISDF